MREKERGRKHEKVRGGGLEGRNNKWKAENGKRKVKNKEGFRSE